MKGEVTITTDWNYFNVPLNVPDIVDGFLIVLGYINPVIGMFLGTALAFFILRGILSMGR